MLLLAALQTRSFFEYCKRQRKKGRKVPKTMGGITWLLYLCGSLFLLLSLVIALVTPGEEAPSQPQLQQPQPTEPETTFRAEKAADTDPLNWQIRWEIFENGALQPSYRRENPISFGDPEDYFPLPGDTAIPKQGN